MNELDKIQLCINADDFGYSDPISSGILEMIDKGLVSSTSIMVQHLNENQIIQLAKYNNISVGLHFNLASKHNFFTPFLNDPFTIAQQFYFNKLKVKELENELEAQYEYLKKVYHKPITHIDTHQHIHIIPQIAQLLTDFAKRNNIPYVRLGREFSPTFGIKKWLFNNSAKSLKNSLPIFGLNLMGKNFTSENIRMHFNFLKNKKITKALWIVHPGYCTSQSTFTDSYNKERENEMDVLKKLEEFILLHSQILPLNKIYGT